MKRNKLYEVLKKAAPALASRDIIPVFSCFCFDEKHVMAYDDLIGIQIPLDIGFRGAIKGHILMSWLGSLRGPEVDIARPDDTTIVLKCLRSKITLPVLSKDDFLFEFPKKKPAFEMKISPETVQLLAAASTSMGLDPSHPWRMGITLERTEKQTIFYSCDNLTATRVTSPATGSKFVVILQPRFCELMMSFSKSEGAATMKLSGKWLVAEFKSGLKLFHRAGQDPDLKQHRNLFKNFDDLSSKKFAKMPKPMRRALERAEAMIPYAKEPSTVMTIEDKMLLLKTKSDSGEVRDKMRIDRHQPITFEFPPGLLLRACGRAKSIAVSEKFMALKGGTFSHMIAPLLRGTQPNGDKDGQ